MSEEPCYICWKKGSLIYSKEFCIYSCMRCNILKACPEGYCCILYSEIGNDYDRLTRGEADRLIAFVIPRGIYMTYREWAEDMKAGTLGRFM